MNKRLRVSMFTVFIVSLLLGCQIHTPEQVTSLSNDVIDAISAELEKQDEIQPEEAQQEQAQQEEVQPEQAQLEQVQPDEIQTEDVLPKETTETIAAIEEDGSYTSKDEVALYIHTYNKLPSNYITKKEAQGRGWNSKENTMAKILPGMSIGGDYFGNYEGILPKAEGRSYKECDIDYVSGSRNAKRIVFSTDGLIFYTEDHYSTFEQLY